jgi:hypothetical protein
MFAKLGKGDRRALNEEVSNGNDPDEHELSFPSLDICTHRTKRSYYGPHAQETAQRLDS